jgi:RNA polymerase sigma-70 factor, ECF subfamily
MMYSDVHDLEKRDNDCIATSLYKTYGRIIFSYLRVKGVVLQDTEDLLAEIFLAAMIQDDLATLSPDRQLLWLKRVAHNKLSNFYRHQSRHPQAPLETIAEMKVDGKEEPEQIVLRSEEYSRLRRYIKQLPSLQQQILQLRYSDELSYEEIGLLINKREETVRKHLSRAILFLRRVYQQKEGENTW